MYKNSKLYAAISYLTWIGWVIALVLRDNNDPLVRRHLNQALILNIVESVGTILVRIGGIFGIIGEVIDLVCLVLFIMGIVRALKMSEEPLPLIGDITLIG